MQAAKQSGTDSLRFLIFLNLFGNRLFAPQVNWDAAIEMLGVEPKTWAMTQRLNMPYSREKQMMWMFPPGNTVTEWVLNRGGFSCTFSQVIDIGFLGLWQEKTAFAKHSGSLWLPRVVEHIDPAVKDFLLHLDTRLLTSSQYHMTSLVDGALEFICCFPWRPLAVRIVILKRIPSTKHNDAFDPVYWILVKKDYISRQYLNLSSIRDTS